MKIIFYIFTILYSAIYVKGINNYNYKYKHKYNVKQLLQKLCDLEKSYYLIDKSFSHDIIKCFSYYREYVDNINNIPEDYTINIIDNTIVYKSIISPSNIINSLQIDGEDWSYFRLLKSIEKQKVIGISISICCTYLIVIDNIELISSKNLHRVNIIPSILYSLINKLYSNNICFDVL